jgi:hypothetical protein
MKDMYFIEEFPGGGLGWFQLWTLAAWAAIRAAATCRNFGLSKRQGLAIQGLPCLSFVMPEQHGTPVAELGDGK